MDHSYLEHANLTVTRLAPAAEFLLAALPGWRVRGRGHVADWYGKPMNWLHLGNDTHYIALQDGGEGAPVHWQTHAVAAKHLGFVVDDLDALIARLQRAGHAPDHLGGSDAHRRSIYYNPDELLQIEFVQYLSADPALRNVYA